MWTTSLLVAQIVKVRWIGYLAIALICITVAACVKLRPIEQPRSGFDALKFRKTVFVEDHAVTTYMFSAGSMLVADQYIEEYGAPVYCGQVGFSGQVVVTCVGFEAPDTLVLAPGLGFKEVRRKIPAGSVERMKLKL